MYVKMGRQGRGIGRKENEEYRDGETGKRNKKDKDECEDGERGKRNGKERQR